MPDLRFEERKSTSDDLSQTYREESSPKGEKLTSQAKRQSRVESRARNPQKANKPEEAFQQVALSPGKNC